MYAVEKLSSYITRGVYTVSGPFHPFGGAVDIIVVQQQDGSFKSSPWYVRFGKFQGVLKTREKVVTVCVNGVEAGFHMYLDPRGEAYFLRDCDSDDGGDFELSPPSSGDEMDENVRSASFKKVQSCNYDGGQGEPIMPLDNGNEMIVSRTSSQRSRIFGLVFGSKSNKKNSQGGAVDRASSLECAEIAANLLETKWSTNLHSSDHRTDNRTEKGDLYVRIDDNKMITSHEEGSDDNFGAGTVSREHSEVAIDNSPTSVTNFIGDDTNPCLTTDESVNESVGSHGEKLGDSSQPYMVREVHLEETISQTSTSRTHEEVLEVYTLESGDLGDRSTLISEPVIESDEYNISSNGSVLSNTTDDAQHSGSMPDELAVASPEEKYDGEKEVSSLTYTETLQNSTVTFDVSTRTHDTLNLSSRGDEPLQQCSDVTCNTSEHICEVPSRPESEKATDGENYSGCHNQILELTKVEVSSAFLDSQAHSPSKAAFHNRVRTGLNTNSPQKFCSSESQVIWQDREVSEVPQGKVSGVEPVDLTENRCQVIEEEDSAPICHVPVPNDIFSISYEGLANDISREKPCLRNRLEIAQDDSTFLLSESLEDEQFQFSDIESFSVKQINPEIQASNEAVETDDRMLLMIKGDMEELEDTNSEECFENVAGSQTSPLDIPRSIAQFGQTELLTKSLPITRSYIHDLERSNLLHPLSCSLDLNSESYEQDMLNKDISSSSKLKSDSGRKKLRDGHTSHDAVTALDSESKQAHNVSPNYSSVELSLCKHLLFDNMGADSASRVFEANKVNLEKFSTLGPSLIKNDKLVVRIGLRYFPWDAAAPIILGMLCFGQDQIFEPQGMISVDRGEKNFNDDPSGAMVPSGGSWRLWPFSLKKSKTLSTARSVPESTIQENEDVAPVKSQSLMGHDDLQRAKFTKKKVRSLTPTSEELASLNLREGRNMITFSFSTAMLGQQQVDARIYLWKWNTRIVISDVDGTITKSDVLGQFMPLVGKDWSQTGVAQLFSAIKENGYQFLFLSARAIAQAYITRQFLFNLKQDGKALPDGPVVISPDGLFPSLFREVIRRAPHEFKIACLEDIRALFSPECNPFYAGFGNRDTDEISYLKVGVPKGKIFIVNPKGEVVVNRRVNSKSYTSLHALVNGMFPPMSTAEQEDFNSWNYWKLPLPDVDI